MNREKRLASKRRYRESAKGKKSISRYMAAYRKTKSSDEALKRHYEKRKKNADKQAAWKENNRRWLQTSPGKNYTRKHNLELPAATPDEFVKSIELLYQLRKETSNEHR